MGFKDYLAVLDSDLYDYAGATKSILARIAHLIIEPNKEDPVTGKTIGEPKPDVGFCIASQDYIACQLGLSVSTVWAATKQFKKDCWLEVVKTRDRYGDHNKYRWADGAFERIVARARQRTEQWEFIRSKQTSMERFPREGRFARDKDAGSPLIVRPYGEPTHPFEDTPLRKLLSPPYANCNEATAQIALSALGNLPSKLVRVDVDLSVCNKACHENPTGHDGDSHTPCEASQSQKQQPHPQGTSSPDTPTQRKTPVDPWGEDFSPSPAAELLPQPGMVVSPVGDAPSSAFPQTPMAKKFSNNLDKVREEFAAANDDTERDIARDDFKGWVDNLKEMAEETRKGVWQFPDGSEFTLVPLPPKRKAPKPVCRKCGGPVKNNDPMGVCLKCKFDPTRHATPYVELEDRGKHLWPKPLGTKQAKCLNCGVTYFEAHFDSDYKFCSKSEAANA